MLDGYTPEGGARILDHCSTPIPDNLQRSAEQYLNHLKASFNGLKKNKPSFKRFAWQRQCLPE